MLCSVFKLDVPNYVKIDVDGTEVSVIQSGLETFRNPNLKSVLIEVDLNDDPEVREISRASRTLD